MAVLPKGRVGDDVAGKDSRTQALHIGIHRSKEETGPTAGRWRIAAALVDPDLFVAVQCDSMRSEIIGMFRRGQQVRERQDHADAICRRAGHALYEIRAGWDAATRTAVFDCRIRTAAIRNGCRRPLD